MNGIGGNVNAQLVDNTGTPLNLTAPVQTYPLEQTVLSNVATGAVALGPWDTTGYNCVIVDIIQPGTGCTISYYGSPDGTNYKGANGFNASGSYGGPTATSGDARRLVFPKLAKWFQATITTYGSGNVQIAVTLCNMSQSPGSVGWVLGAFPVGNGISSIAPVAVGGRSRSFGSEIANQSNDTLAHFRTNPLGHINVSAEHRFAYLSSAATTTLKSSGAGKLARVVVGKGAAASTLTLYDNASAGSGTIIALIDCTNPISLDFDVTFANGLTAVVAGGSPSITVSLL